MRICAIISKFLYIQQCKSLHGIEKIRQEILFKIKTKVSSQKIQFLKLEWIVTCNFFFRKKFRREKSNPK